MTGGNRGTREFLCRVFGVASRSSERVTGRTALLILAGVLATGAVLGETSVGVARAAATTTVTLSIPLLYGMDVPQQQAESDGQGRIWLASSKPAQAAETNIRLLLMSTIGEGTLTLRRFVSADNSAVEGGLLPAAYAKDPENDRGECERCASSLRGPKDVLVFPQRACSWKALEDRVGRDRVRRASRAGSVRAVTVTYELWQF